MKVDSLEWYDLLRRLHNNDHFLTTLSLFKNSIGAEGGKELAAALKNNSSLTTLNLGDNNCKWFNRTF